MGCTLARRAAKCPSRNLFFLDDAQANRRIDYLQDNSRQHHTIYRRGDHAHELNPDLTGDAPLQSRTSQAGSGEHAGQQRAHDATDSVYPKDVQ